MGIKQTLLGLAGLAATTIGYSPATMAQDTTTYDHEASEAARILKNQERIRSPVRWGIEDKDPVGIETIVVSIDGVPTEATPELVKSEEYESYQPLTWADLPKDVDSIIARNAKLRGPLRFGTDVNDENTYNAVTVIRHEMTLPEPNYEKQEQEFIIGISDKELGRLGYKTPVLETVETARMEVPTSNYLAEEIQLPNNLRIVEIPTASEETSVDYSDLLDEWNQEESVMPTEANFPTAENVARIVSTKTSRKTTTLPEGWVVVEYNPKDTNTNITDIYDTLGLITLELREEKGKEGRWVSSFIAGGPQQSTDYELTALIKEFNGKSHPADSFSNWSLVVEANAAYNNVDLENAEDMALFHQAYLNGTATLILPADLRDGYTNDSQASLESTIQETADAKVDFASLSEKEQALYATIDFCEAMQAAEANGDYARINPTLKAMAAKYDGVSANRMGKLVKQTIEAYLGSTDEPSGLSAERERVFNYGIAALKEEIQADLANYNNAVTEQVIPKVEIQHNSAISPTPTWDIAYEMLNKRYFG